MMVSVYICMQLDLLGCVGTGTTLQGQCLLGSALYGGILYFIALSFILSHIHCFFVLPHQQIDLYQRCSNMSIGTMFSTAFAHFGFWCHIFFILAIFQTFSLLLYLLYRSVILIVSIIIVLGYQEVKSAVSVFTVKQAYCQYR